MEKIKIIIRIVTATTMSLIVFNFMLRLGLYLQVPHLTNIWQLVLVLAIGIITYENLKIWNEKDSKVVNAK